MDTTEQQAMPCNDCDQGRDKQATGELGEAGKVGKGGQKEGKWG